MSRPPNSPPAPSEPPAASLPTLDMSTAGPSAHGDEELASVLDAVLGALQEGKGIDRIALQKRYPELAGQIDLLGDLHGGGVIQTHEAPAGAPPRPPQICPDQ